MRNNLDRETSPYLLQHKDNPVHWQAWGPDALALAREQNKPILLSIGYAACHWCHVMAHESFEEPGIAGVMNELFVNIKVDREERPDIDAIYMSALHLLGEPGGWPLTMFLTPAGEPFWGGTYFPPTARWGRPGFPDVLRQIAAVYRQEPDKIRQNTVALTTGLARMSAPDRDAPAAVSITPAVVDAAARRILEHIDPDHGGLQGAPKFPQPPTLLFLWRAYERTGEAAFRDAVLLTLERMSQGGIYDHLGGGYARYSTDAAWLVPHFEKMLYDNAQILDLLTLAWLETGSPLFAERARETVAWVEREMIAENGAFAASLDADSEGEEGKFYVWTDTEIAAVLGDDDTATFARAYDVGPGGNWEGRTILNRSARPERGSDADEARLAAMRARLLDARDARIRPGWDDKVLADWNGLMIRALANAGAAFAEPGWTARAEAAFAGIVADLTTADGRLCHAFRNGRAQPAGLLDDYAAMTTAALALFEATGTPSYRDHAVAWADLVERHFADIGNGGYFLTADDAEALIARTRTATDNASPSGNGLFAQALARLYLLTGEDAYRARAERTLAAFVGEAARSALAAPTLLGALDLLTRAVQIIVIGRRGDPATAELLAAAARAPLVDRVLSVVEPGAAIAVPHPAAGKTDVDGHPTAYVCVGTVCSLPVTDPGVLSRQLGSSNPAAT